VSQAWEKEYEQMTQAPEAVSSGACVHGKICFVRVNLNIPKINKEICHF